MTATTNSYSLSLHDALPIFEKKPELCEAFLGGLMEGLKYVYLNPEKSVALHLESVKEFQGGSVANQKVIEYGDRKSTRLNSSHVEISYAVFCLKKQK